MAERVRVLIVDDSAFFRKRIRQQLRAHADIIIAGEAANGGSGRDDGTPAPDVVTMDVAMPEMDGISAVREIMRSRPTNVLMVSALTREGASCDADALDAGAVDFLPKTVGNNGDHQQRPEPGATGSSAISAQATQRRQAGAGRRMRPRRQLRGRPPPENVAPRIPAWSSSVHRPAGRRHSAGACRIAGRLSISRTGGRAYAGRIHGDLAERPTASVPSTWRTGA